MSIDKEAQLLLFSTLYRIYLSDNAKHCYNEFFFWLGM